jgi:hypothetical protein
MNAASGLERVGERNADGPIYQPFPHGPGRTRTCARRIMSSVSVVIPSDHGPVNTGEVPSDQVRFAQMGTRGYPCGLDWDTRSPDRTIPTGAHLPMDAKEPQLSSRTSTLLRPFA